MMHTNRQKMEDRHSKISQDKNDMRKVVEERIVDENDYREFEKRLKMDDRDRRKIYKDTLDHQMRLMDLQKMNYGTMTNEEKKLNKLDLVHYKTKNDFNFEAMIPGINNLNSIGSSPLRNGAK